MLGNVSPWVQMSCVICSSFLHFEFKYNYGLAVCLYASQFYTILLGQLESTLEQKTEQALQVKDPYLSFISLGETILEVIDAALKLDFQP